MGETQSADVDWLKAAAEHRLLQLRALDEIDAIQSGVDSFARSSGRPPADWPALLRARAIRGIPLDPSGVPYVLTPEGRVRLSEASPLFPLPAEPQGRGPAQ